MITEAGDRRTAGLAGGEPVEERPGFQALFSEDGFFAADGKETILEHIDREIDRLEQYHRTMERDIQKEMDYLDKEKFDRSKATLLWGGINQVTIRTDAMRLAWLKDWRLKIEKELSE